MVKAKDKRNKREVTNMDQSIARMKFKEDKKLRRA